MRTQQRAPNVVLNSFLDMMTCMLGVIIMIVLLTGLDASRLQVLIPTPMEHVTGKKPIFIECRNNELFLLPLTQLRKLANDELKKITESAQGQGNEALQRMVKASVEYEAYRVDFAYVLTGQFAIEPIPTARGYKLVDIRYETTSNWFGRIIGGLDKIKEMLSFVVRDDSFEVFKYARALAGIHNIDVSYELLDASQPIKFGLGGTRSLAQ